ncbi:MAG: tetratricopeptide repeat protein [Ardenticatenaceae bacterium]|nr:tetratricopeptide repeat protein [Ardenticatenaceae bacterium]
MKAFQRGDYDTALAMWEDAAAKLSRVTLPAALAEAYFRRGLKQGDVGDLQKAVELRPDDGRFYYHLGLMEQRNGRLAEAVAALEKVVKQGGDLAKRAAFPLALIGWQQGKAVEKTAVWPLLTAKQQGQLQQAGTFLRRPYVVADDANVLWRGLMAYDNGRLDEAQQLLTQAAKLSDGAGISHFYLGAIAAQQEAWLSATEHWVQAFQQGHRSPRLMTNLAEAYHRLAEERLANGETESALDAVAEAYRYQQEDRQLNDLLAYLEQQKGYEAARSGNWDTAQMYWEMAQEHGGGNFRLVCNLALAQEQAEAYYEAALLWREALRRRPRRDDHPDAISDEQVSQLWQRTAVAYEKAEFFDEGVDVRKMAVKWQPDSLPVRMNYVEALLQNGRLQAAQNELERVLERDKNHIPALLLLGEVLAENETWWHAAQAVHYWRRVLELEPGNQAAQENLVDYYVNRGEEYLDWGHRVREALENFEQALIYAPKNAKVLAKIGGCLLELGEKEEAEQHFAKAIEIDPHSLDVRSSIIIYYLSVGDEAGAWERANQVQASLETVPALFYINIASNCLYNRMPEMAKKWLDKAEAVADKGEPVMVTIGEMAMIVPGAAEVCEPYLHRAIAIGQEPGQANFVLGVLAAKRGDTKMADKYWREARKIAKRNKDEVLLERIGQAEMMFRSPFGGLLSRILGGEVDPRLLERMLPGMLGELFEDDDFDEDDDEFFF